MTVTAPDDPQPRVMVEFGWGVTDGSAPETVTVTWDGVVPSIEELTLVIREVNLTGNRYELDSDESDLVAGPMPSMEDLCQRSTCGHTRMPHPRNGPCAICAESVACRSFVEARPLRALPVVNYEEGR
jgi:hypothetical protein